MTQLAQMIRRRRIQQRLTQRQAAERSSISLATWQSLERETVDPDTFQDLTLSAAAHGLDLPLTTICAWANRPLPVTTSTTKPPPDLSIDDQLDELVGLLRHLADLSEISYLLAYGQAIEVTDHLVRIHEGDQGAAP